MSLLGDGLVPAALWLSWTHPAIFAIALVLAVAVMVTAIVLLAKFLRALVRRFRRPAVADGV